MSQVGRIIAGDCYVRKTAALTQLAAAGAGGLLGAGVGGVGAIANMQPANRLTEEERKSQRRAILLSSLLGGSVGTLGGSVLQQLASPSRARLKSGRGAT